MDLIKEEVTSELPTTLANLQKTVRRVLIGISFQFHSIPIAQIDDSE
jgi:hypothetical protein